MNPSIFSLFLLLQCTLRHSFGQRTPTISYITPPDIISRIGGTVEMACSVIYATEYPILWVRLPSNCSIVRTNDIRFQINDKCTPIPLSSGSALIIRDHRFSMRYDTASSTYTLQIKDVQKTDEAIYQCQIIVGINNKVTRHVIISVSQPPIISDNSTRALVVEEHSPAELLCQASGKPTPSISWRRENNAILPTGGTRYRGNGLKIHTVKKEDRGTYYCVADNGVGEPVRRNVALEVEFPPVIRVNQKVLAQSFGYDVELFCYVEAYPRPSIHWIHQGIQLSSNRFISVDGGYLTDDDTTETSVRIKQLSVSQLGDYTCKAQNKLGSNEKIISVIESDEPNCIFGICESSSSSSVKFFPKSFKSLYYLPSGFLLLLYSIIHMFVM